MNDRFDLKLARVGQLNLEKNINLVHQVIQSLSYMNVINNP